jgi:hypothetical protein
MSSLRIFMIIVYSKAQLINKIIISNKILKTVIKFPHIEHTMTDQKF